MATTLTVAETEIQRLLDARHHDPFSILGKHQDPQTEQEVVRVLMPNATQVLIHPGDLPLKRIKKTPLFEWQGTLGTVKDIYQLHWYDEQGNVHKSYDPYAFPLQLKEFDLHLFSEGKHWDAHLFLGAHIHTANNIPGVLFAVWAPNAERVSVVGDFNQWDGRWHPMRSLGETGVWELFIPHLPAGTLYKYEIRNRQSGNVFLKADPYAQGFELRPKTSSYVVPASEYQWQDADWLEKRAQLDWQHAPLSIYEVHLGSWLYNSEGEFFSYRDIAPVLADYVKQMGFTHIELLPVAEYPFDGSWGYQVTGYYAPTSRFGSPDDFRYLVDYCHQQGIGVFVDWVPGHFPKDAHGLAWFDGTPLYEYADPRQGEHREWGTLIFNYGRHEVRNFLVSNALFWLKEFHIDGLRVDAVASMLYLDYSRNPGEWIPNQYGGNENLDAIDFMRQLNIVTHAQYPGTLIMAEESTSWPQVTRPTWVGGLGFSMKWNMGWMHDSLQYMSHDAVYRSYHHDYLTFGLVYAFSENFILPFSHDEVVHGKKSMIDKMPGDAWQKFANLRVLYTLMWTYPGKKLLFMGNEFAQGQEWNFAASLEWNLLDIDFHQGIQQLVKDLNHLYQRLPALYHDDFDYRGFSWIDCHDAAQSVISYSRQTKEQEQQNQVIVLLNFTPIPRYDYRIGVSYPGWYEEVFNSDSMYYGGSNVGNTVVHTQEESWMGRPYALSLTLPPLGGIVLKRQLPPAEHSEETSLITDNRKD